MRKLHLSSDTRLAINTAGIEGSFWFSWAFCAYGSVYLLNNGFKASQLGVLNAFSYVVIIASTMLWGLVSDRINSVKRSFIICLAGTVVVFFFIPVVPVTLSCWALLMMLYFPLTNIFHGAAPTLMENLCIRLCSQKRLNYGPIRAFGSISYTVAGLIAVALVQHFGVPISFWLHSLLMLVAIVFAWRSEDPKAPEEHRVVEKRKVNPKELLSNYFYVAFLIFIAVLYIPMTAEGAFLPYLMEDIGVSSTQYGTLLAVRAAAEVPFLLINSKLRQHFPLKYLIILAVIFSALECFGFCFFAHGLSGLLLFGILFGFGSGLMIGSVAQYALRLAPDHLKATAQTLYTAVSSVSGIVGNLAGGFLYQAVGARFFYRILGLLFLFSALIFILSFLFSRGRYNPADEISAA